MQTLRHGSRGGWVRRWQTFLMGQGHDVGGVDGKFGDRTEAATKAFQQRQGLKADGVVGNATFAKAMLLGLDVVSDPDNQDPDGPNWPVPPDFRPIVAESDRQTLFGRFRYRHEPTDREPGRIVILDGWAAANIVPVTVPQLAGKQGAPASGKVAFHVKAHDQLRALWQAWQDAGLLDRVLTWDGSFNPRLIRGDGRRLSMHTYGTAFDINVKWNRLGARPALRGEQGCVRELVTLANQHGFYWGGHFKSRPDGMHFEVAQLL